MRPLAHNLQLHLSCAWRRACRASCPPAEICLVKDYDGATSSHLIFALRVRHLLRAEMTEIFARPQLATLLGDVLARGGVVRPELGGPLELE